MLGLLKALSEGGQPTVHELAARFKTRRETIYRDFHTLEAIGYPIVGDESGRLSRPRLALGVRATVPPVALTRKETAALVWAVKQAGARQPFRSALATAMAKLQAMAAARDGHLAMALDGAVGGWDRGVKDYEASEPVILRLVRRSSAVAGAASSTGHQGKIIHGASPTIHTGCFRFTAACIAWARCPRTRTSPRSRSTGS